MNKRGYGGYASLWMDNAIEEYGARVKYGYEYFHSFRYDYRTYLDGENPYEPSSDIDDKKWLSSKAIKYFGYREDNKADGGVDAFIRIIELVLDLQRQPVLFHCQGGRHRTGMVAMAIRTLQGGEWLESTGDMNKAEYEYSMHNKTMFRQSNLDFIREFSSSEPKFFEWLGKYGDLLNPSN
jgi:protein tyrosine/serine phosphatase